MDQWIHYHLKFTFYSRTPPHYGFMENLLFESFFLMMFRSKVMPICSFTSVLSLHWLDLHGCSFLLKALQSCKHSLKKQKYIYEWSDASVGHMKYLQLFQLQDYRLLQNCHVAVTFLISLSGFSCLAIKGLTPAVC